MLNLIDERLCYHEDSGGAGWGHAGHGLDVFG